MIPIIIGIILLIIAVYFGFKILKNIIIGAILIGLVILASFLIFGSIPDLRGIPIIGGLFQTIGGLFPSMPTTAGEILVGIRNIIYNIEILGVNRDAHNNLLVTVVNTGKLEVSELRVFVDNQTVRTINLPKDPLKSGEVTIIQTDWNRSFTEVLVQTKQVNATYVLK
ncbi:MAG: hypothetical protein QMD12_01540 [Candidatus Aenigmarchaeota archaeon]|nr:hypothetical protein [Candidatus Aenigmarchaeota archaeon]